MLYNLKKDNYNTFNVYEKNILAPRSYFIPFSNSEEMMATDIRTERYNSSMVAVLSGEWDFKYYSKNSEIPDTFDTDNIETDIINVPSMWQFTGYEKPYYINTRYQFPCNPPYIPEDCSAGVYIKKFMLDEVSGNYNLMFLGAAGALDVFVNGKFAGYSEGSHNTAEFEITEFLQTGENEVVAVIHKWCTGTYLECQDMFRNNGIFRDVLIIRTGDNSIYDFEAKTTYNGDGSYMLDVIPSFKITDEVAFTAEIKDGDKLIASKSINVCPGKIDKLTFDVLDVEEWSAEIPKLYNLYLSISKSGEIIEIIRKRIGFKHIEIKGNVFYFNNKRIKLLGVNHHDTNPKTGYVMSIEDMEQDVKLFKEYNVNCVRTSHYPPDPSFLDLCDEYGIYVVDEADIECHGVCEIHKPDLISKNSQWQNHFWDRVYRMYQRDKNHASITMWSLGNESGGYKCQDFCYKNLKTLTVIPVHYEGACRTPRWSYDVHSEMYTGPFVCRRIAAGRGLPSKYYKRPFYLCEYAHAMGVGAGDLEQYVQIFYSSDIMMGGCIWEFADHAVYNENGTYKYTYGGDNGEWKHDGNFCVDGLFFPDRTPHSGALQMKVCYRPVRAKRLGGGEFEFFNHNYFKTEQLTVKYSVRKSGIEDAAGEFLINIEPQRAFKQKIDIKADGHTAIVFSYYDGDNLIAEEQIVLNDTYKCKELKSSSEAPDIRNSEGRIIVSFDNGELIYNNATGEIESYVFNSKQLINQIPLNAARGIIPQLYRAPIDNDMYLNKAWIRKGLDKLAFECKPSKGNSYKITDNSVLIQSVFKLRTPKCRDAGKFIVNYTVKRNGEITVNYEFVNLPFKFVPRLGVSVEMPKAYSNIKYFGLDKQSLSDFHEHAVFDVKTLRVSDMHENYIKPQESGMRYKTYWAEVTDDDGTGFRFESENSFTFNANHYNVNQCAKALHAEDLKEYNTVNVHIDGFMMGAGSNSCGPVPAKEHKLRRVKRYGNSFRINPVGDQNV